MSELRPDNMTGSDAGMDRPADRPDWLTKRLEWFRDLKFGIILHWGIYAQWGCTESWPLVAEEPWARDPQLPAWIDAGEDLATFQKQYRALNTTFDPRSFDPDAWAELIQRAGARYCCFTTKHHDGFCLFDTATTTYRTTDASCPMHRGTNANVTRVLFDACRRRKLAISAYFSKSDWSCEDYWSCAPEHAPARTRNPNYDTTAHPEKWGRFVQFTHDQIEELMTGYGPIDLLWLDGGQVRPPEQDIDMDRLVTMARTRQPGLIVVDRTVGGEHENVLTPEQHVPESPIDEPWETCLTLGTSFSHKPNDTYRSAGAIIALLADVVAKGGNLLLGIGPDADGVWPERAVRELEAVGDWLEVNGEAIYGTRRCDPWSQRDDRLDVRFTGRGSTRYAIILARPMQRRPPREIRLRSIELEPGAEVRLLAPGTTLAWHREAGDVVVTLPPELLDRAPEQPAWVLALDAKHRPGAAPGPCGADP
jgi:alpha-L-fucosidase